MAESVNDLITNSFNLVVGEVRLNKHQKQTLSAVCEHRTKTLTASTERRSEVINQEPVNKGERSRRM